MDIFTLIRILPYIALYNIGKLPRVRGYNGLNFIFTVLNQIYMKKQKITRGYKKASGFMFW